MRVKSAYGSPKDVKNNRATAPDLELVFGSILYSPPGYPNSGIGFTGIVVLNHPHNIGSVSLRSPVPKDTSVIRANYLQS